MRSQARECAFKIIYASLFGTDVGEEFRGKVYKKGALKGEDAAFSERLINLYFAHKEELNSLLLEKVEHFAEHRIYQVDKAILLLAMAEIMYADDVPPIVSVSEAAAIAAKYSTENSAGFVNGVLAGVINHGNH